MSEHLRVCEDGRCAEYVRSLGGVVDDASHALDAEPEARAAGARRRTFQSREIVWATFESLARELEVPIDELVNDAMSAYARARGYAVDPPDPPAEVATARPPALAPRRGAAPPAGAAPRAAVDDPLEETHDAPSALDRSYAPARGGFDDDDLARTAARGAFVRPAAGRPYGSDGPESRTTPRMKAPLPAPSRPGGVGRPLPSVGAPPPPPPPARSSGGSLAPPPRTMRMPDARESSPRAAPGRQLVLEYRGRTCSVDKERFLIGRSKTQADLRLDDPNVSRQHAVIERVGAAFYIVDLGSTNGVEVAGERVARRALADGDCIVITTHEIRCALR